MREAITALSWELVARYRWLYILAAVWLVLLSLMGFLLSAMGCDPQVGVSLVLTLCGPLLFVLCGLAHGWETHLENAGSCFPARLFTLPVPVAVLVGPPLLLGTAVVFFFWLLSALCVLRPMGMEDVPIWWPALGGAAIVAWLQAATWYPFPLPWLRLICLAGLITGFFFGGLILTHKQASESLLIGLFLVLLLLAYPIAYVGVKRARQGAGLREPSQALTLAVSDRYSARAPFLSPLRAQMWLEWKVNGWAFFFVTGLCLMITLPSMFFSERALQLDFSSALPWVQHAKEAVGASWLLMSCMLIVPFLLALCGGSGMGKAALNFSDRACPPFLGTRPISMAEMVKAKLLISAVGVLGTWTILFAASLAWAVCTSRVGEMTDRVVDLTGSGWFAAGVLVGSQALLIAITWLWLASDLWEGALGRPVLSVMLAIIRMLALSGVGVVVAFWHDQWWPALDGAIVVGLAGKVLVVWWVTRQLLRQRLMTPRGLTQVFVVWLLCTMLITSLALGLTSGGARVAGIAVLLMPLARPLAAPLALAHNRTR